MAGRLTAGMARRGGLANWAQMGGWAVGVGPLLWFITQLKWQTMVWTVRQAGRRKGRSCVRVVHAILDQQREGDSRQGKQGSMRDKQDNR